VPGADGSTLEAGPHIYAGNARGPGGIAARLVRHCRADKVCHWHIDRLTTRVAVHAAARLPDGDECAIIAGLLDGPGVTVPARRLGSSDCARCPAHLVRLGDEIEGLVWLADLAAAAGGDVVTAPF
jgi:Uri superfamily endonuclease